MKDGSRNFDVNVLGNNRTLLGMSKDPRLLFLKKVYHTYGLESCRSGQVEVPEL